MSSRHERRQERRNIQKEVDKHIRDIKKNPMIADPEEFIIQRANVSMPLYKINEMISQAYDQGDASGCYRTYMYAMAAALMALRDQFHFGHDRGQRFIEAMKNKLAFSIDGDDDVKYVYETMGINVDIRDIVSPEDAKKYSKQIDMIHERLGRS